MSGGDGGCGGGGDFLFYSTWNRMNSFFIGISKRNIKFTHYFLDNLNKILLIFHTTFVVGVEVVACFSSL